MGVKGGGNYTVGGAIGVGKGDRVRGSVCVGGMRGRK